MKKMAFTALGLGVAYLMRNKGARDKFMKQVNTFMDMPTSNQNSNSNS